MNKKRNHRIYLTEYVLEIFKKTLYWIFLIYFSNRIQCINSVTVAFLFLFNNRIWIFSYRFLSKDLLTLFDVFFIYIVFIISFLILYCLLSQVRYHPTPLIEWKSSNEKVPIFTEILKNNCFINNLFYSRRFMDHFQLLLIMIYDLNLILLRILFCNCFKLIK